MSAEAPKTVEETQQVETKPVEQPVEIPATTKTPAAESNEAPASTPSATDAAPTTNGVKKGEAVVEAVPASEGILGYKAPGLFKQLYFSKHFFWLSDEALPSETLNAYIRSEKSHTVGHEHAAWARETGQGVLFFCKRAEDKPHPSGVFLLHEVSNVTKEGYNVFSMKVGNHVHKFETGNSAERDSWIVAIEKKVEEAKGLKDEITGRDSYKKNVEEYAKSPAHIIAAAGAAKSERSKSKEPKKSLDAGAITAPAATETKATETSTPAPVEAKKSQKERSQSRKRASIFGSILGKKDEKEAETKQKAEEKKAEHEAKKEDKKIDAEQKEEAKTTHDTSKATEAAEASAVAVVPTAATVAAEKKDDKEEEKIGNSTPDKKGKRVSVFGSFFGKKGVTSPTTEKSEKEVGPATPAKESDVPPVSETAPKLDEPIENKPIDTAAVTAPADAVATEPLSTEPGKESIPATTAESSPKTEKKGGFLAGFIKKAEGKKEETKEEKTSEPAAAEPVTPAPVTTTDGTTETPATKEERPAREKRRTSIFAGLGTMKRKNKEEKESSDATEETPATETKREKSPLPSKIGGLFRRPSKAVKTEESKESAPAEKKTEAPATTEPAAVSEAAATEESKPSTTVPETTESKIVGDVVPDKLHATVHDSVTTAPEVKASA